MRILLIDTATSFVTVSIIKDSEILYNFHEQIITDISSKLIQIIDDGLSKTNIKLEDLDKIMVVNGPGSFTGTRIGVTIAKTIAWSLKKDVIPISSLEVMASTSTNKKYLVPMIDARRGNVFGAIYDLDLNPIMPDKLVNINELSNLDDNYEFLSYDNINIKSVMPNINLIKVINKHIMDNGVNPHNLNPKYLKLTEAEENKMRS